MRILWTATLLLALAGLCYSGPSGRDTVAVGDAAPDFSLPWGDRDSVSFSNISLHSEYAKGPVVLAFYPADWSGGCTKEVCTIRDNFAELGSLKVRIFGISGDYPFAHYHWAKELNLPFVLLSDHLHSVAKAYASFNAEHGYNVRSVFVVGTDGRIAYADREYSVRDSGSFDRLKSALRALR